MALQYICLCLVLVLHTVLSKSCLDYSSNPCLAANHEKLDDATRSAAYTPDNGNMMSDYSLPAGWYRSVSPTAGDMPRTAPEMFYCQATNPIWLRGPLPTEGAGIVMRRACARRYAKVCHRKYSVCIKNCGTFNVYYLHTVRAAKDRYCFGSDSPCPDGQTSENGYTPGCHDNDPPNPTLIDISLMHWVVSDTFPVISPSVVEEISDQLADICLKYGVLDVGDGSARSALHSRERGSLQCDAHRFVPEKYYRLVGDNGAEFVLHEGCVKKNHCSTVLPVWIEKGTHPTDQNVTELTACTTSTECCSYQQKVKVKLCYHDNGLDFYVYQLSGLHMCDMGYCVMPIEDLPNRPGALPMHPSNTRTSLPTDTPITVPKNPSTSTPTTKSPPRTTSNIKAKPKITATDLITTSTHASRTRPGITLNTTTKPEISTTEIESDPSNMLKFFDTAVLGVAILMILGILGVLVYCLLNRASKMKAGLTEKRAGLITDIMSNKENLYHDIADGGLATRPKSTQYEQLDQKEQTHYDKLGPVQNPVYDNSYEKPVHSRPIDPKPDALEMETVD